MSRQALGQPDTHQLMHTSLHKWTGRRTITTYISITDILNPAI